ncbi:hypothetical protein H0H92_001350 [Tricholoma furcatifolium]|nr:hypothetical protein H0H92_001350 [Tricholoma furcatifolium]
MGIPKLWTMLSPVAEMTTLKRLAVNCGFLDNISNIRGLRIGVDASAWIYQAHFHHGKNKNPELATLFARCVELFQLPILPLFVFDGPARPDFKRGKRVTKTPHWLTVDFKDLLDCMGFHLISRQALGEAEAELTWMSRARVVDFVVTEDSDVFVFGVTKVLRSASDGKQDKNVAIYDTRDIMAHPTLKLSTPSFILIAICAGGDYSSGIPGCGVEIAASLGRSGLGVALVDGADRAEWRMRLIDKLRNNTSGVLKRKQPALAAAIPADFPNEEIIKKYLFPLTSEGDAADNPEGRLHLDHTHLLNLSRLVEFVKTRFSWAEELASLFQHLSTTIFPGLAVRQLMLAAHSADLNLPQVPCTMIGDVIGQRRNSQSSDAEVPEVRIKLNVGTIVDPVFSSLVGESDFGVVRAWVPADMLEHVFPALAGQDTQLLDDVAAAHPAQPTATSSYIPLRGLTLSPEPADVIDLTQDVTIDLTGEDSSAPATPVIDLTGNHNYNYRVVVYPATATTPEILELMTDSEEE